MSAPESKSAAVLALAEEFLERYRQGERPSLKEYADRHPELAAEIREVFLAMALMENIALADEPPAAGPPGQGAVTVPAPLQRLGDFRIVREVGRGGMGVVYEAEQVSLGRHVALKVLPPQLLLDAKRKCRFEREAKAAARLHHTNIVPVFGVGEHDGLPYYVMQFIHGLGLDLVLVELKRLNAGDVADAPRPARHAGNAPPEDLSAADVARSLMTGDFRPVGQPSPDTDETIPESPKGPNPVPGAPDGSPVTVPTRAVSSGSITLPGQSGPAHTPRAKKQTYWQSVAQIGVQLAGALEYAHRQGVLHRDVKPSNLLLDTRGTVWVTDFGLAKADDQPNLTDTGDLVGTLRYLPPEAFEGKADARGDVYALGLTLYELLAFRPAFTEKNGPRLIRQVTTAEPPRLGKLNPQVPRDLVTIVHRAIDRDPARRYPSAGALEADLRRFLDDEPILARRVSAAERLLRWARRHRGLAAALAAVGVLLVLLAAGALLVAAHFQKLEHEQRALAAKNEKLADEKEGERARAVRAGNEAEAARQREAAQARELRHNLYLAEMNLAGQAADSPSGIRRVGELLAPWRGQPDLRGWEWYYLRALGHGDLLTLRGHGNVVRAVAWNRDGTRLASAGHDGTVKVWEAATGQEIRTLRGHRQEVNAVAWSPDGTRLASASQDGTVKVWEAATGTATLTLRGHTQSVESVAWSPDGTRLASAGRDETVKVWDAATGQNPLTLRGHGSPLRGVTWSPDGTRLASAGGDRVAKVWDAATGQNTLTLRGHAGGVLAVAWSPDGTRLASGSLDQTVKVWEAAGGKETLTLRGHTDGAASVAWSPDGARLASASHDGTAKVWEAATGRETLTLRGHVQGVTSVAWSPDGTRLASASQDRTVKVWAAATGPEPLPLRGHDGGVLSMAWSPDGTRLASVGYDGTVKVWEPATGKVTLTLRGHTDRVASVAWSPDGTRLASASDDRTARVWDAATGQNTLTLRGHDGGVLSVAWSPDGARLASSSWDHTVKLWEVPTGKLIRTFRGHTDWVASVAWGPDGTRLASGSDDRTAKVWDAATGKEIWTLRGHGHDVNAVAWSPDGARLASASSDATVRVWDAATGQETLTLRGHTNHVLLVAWSPDGTRLASASWDGTAKVWEAAAGKEALTFRAHAQPLWSVAWDPDGTRLASAGEDETILVCDATRGHVLERSPRLLAVLDRRLAADPNNVKDRQARAEIHARQGDWDRAASDICHYLALSPDRPRWYATDWWVVGPYPGDLKQSHPPEDAPDPGQPVAAAATPDGTMPTRLPWQVVPRDANGFVDFAALFGGAESISAYALTRVYSVEKQPVALLVRSGEGVRLWVNGRLVHESPAGRTSDPEAVPASLEAGWNTVLAKVTHGTGAHALSVRLSGEPAEPRGPREGPGGALPKK
jgi:WD40 repeat protein/serine/threonine protein kinase